MLSKENSYKAEIPEIKVLQQITEDEINERLTQYLGYYEDCFTRSQQTKYFEAYEKGLMSNLERKSIEPIALSFLGEKEVRGMQQFFTRSKGWYVALAERHKDQLSKHLGEADGFLSVDESDFFKKVRIRSELRVNIVAGLGNGKIAKPAYF